MIKRNPLPSQEELLSLFYYKDGGLYWKVNKQKALKDSKAGFVCKTHGYYFIRVNTKLYREHRLIWKMLKGVDPVELDHINRNKTDNRIENLREVTRTENNINQNVRKDNISGCRGVSWHSQRQRWRVYLHINGSRKYLGSYREFSEASRVAKEAMDKHYRIEA